MEEKIRLVFPTKEYQKQIEEYLEEFFKNGEYKLHGAGGLDRIKDVDEWLKKVNDDLSEKKITDHRVPATLFLAIRNSDNRLIGTIQIRHRLNEKLLFDSGHIGDSVRPTERRKGYATEMIRMALEECRKMGIKQVLITCNSDNIGSEKSIINNGGILENIVVDEDGNKIKRYWITLSKGE
ncbi:MAG: GNAT family N-acetyltransferase [Clostridia bacterium]|nr:GNAT family N-acetyltransferase [Clostridia bacterium]